MKRLIAGIAAASLAISAGATTLAPVQLLNPAGSTSGQVIVSSGPASAPAWGSVPAADLAPIAANSVLGNASGSSAAPSAVAIPSCSTSSSALQWATSTGPACNIAINAATLNGVTLAAPGAIGGTTPGSGAFTTLSASSTVSGTGFSTYLASPPAIGGTAPAAGAFTTLSASGAVSGTGFSTYLSSPPAIGSTAAGTGAFTTLSASSTVSGTGFSTYLASPPAIGTTTAAAGKFTTLQATSTITPSSTSGIVGTATNDSANAGSIGELLQNSTATTSATTGTPLNATSVSLTAGDWDVSGLCATNPAGTTTTSIIICGVNSTSATFQNVPGSGGFFYAQALTVSVAAGGQVFLSAPVTRISLASTTTVYLIAQANFAISTMTVSGYIRARRVR